MFGQMHHDYPSDRVVRDLNQVNHPPFIPRLNIPQNYNNILPDIIIALVNHIILTSRNNNIRIYCFNKLSDNNFQNQDFIELVELIIGLTILNVEYERANIEDAVNDAIERGCTYHASKETLNNKNLHQYIISREYEDWIRNNLDEMNQKLNMINRMMSSNIQNQSIHNQFDNRFSNTSNSFSGYGSRNQSSRFPSIKPNYPTTGYQMFSSNRGNEQKETFSSRRMGNIQQNTNVVNKPQQNKGIEMRDKKILEGLDMNGNNFFGTNLDIGSVMKRKEITLNNLTESVDEQNVLSFITGTTLEDVMLTTKVKHVQVLDKNSNIQTFRSYGIVCEPIINKSQISKDIGPILGYTENNIAGINLISIATQLKNLLATYNNNIDGDKQYLLDLIRVISHINNFLTDAINEFLLESLNGIATIDSFIEDIVDLKNLLNVKQKEVLKGWETFCHNVIASLTHKLEDSDYQLTIENIFMDEEKKDTILLTKIVTATSLNMTYIQFGCLVDRNNSIIVDGNVTPNVFEVIDGVFSMKESECDSLEDYIILNDGVHLKVYKDYINNQYKLKRVK